MEDICSPAKRWTDGRVRIQTLLERFPVALLVKEVD